MHLISFLGLRMLFTKRHVLIFTLLGLPASAQSVYVANYNADTISIINSATNTIEATVGVCHIPEDVAISPDGKRAYVACGTFGGSGALSVLDTASKTVITTISGIGTFASSIAISPDSAKVYVTSLESGTVYIIDAVNNSVSGQLTGFACGPLRVTIKPDGSRLYVVDSCGGPVAGHVRVFDTSTNTMIASIQVGENPHGMAITPDGTRLYVTNSRDAFPLGTVSVVDTNANSVISTTSTSGSAPGWAAASPIAPRVFVSNFGGVDILAVATSAVLTTIPLDPFYQCGIAVHPDGKKAYVASCYFDRVFVLDLVTSSVSATIPMPSGSLPFGVAVSPQSYNFLGFSSPVSSTAINSVKAGQVIPLKFQITDSSGSYVFSTTAVTSILSQPAVCNAAPTVIISEDTTAAGSTELRYDSPTNSFIYNWKTDRQWTGCRLLQVSLADGTNHFATFSFR